MGTPQPVPTPVLIVGAEPAGAVTALALAAHGVPSLVFDHPREPPQHRWVDIIDGRSMELLRHLGLAPRVRAAGIAERHCFGVQWTRAFTEPPVLAWHLPSVDQRRRQYAGINDGTAPVEPYQAMPAGVLQRLLHQALSDEPLVQLWPEHRLVDLQLGTDGVTATVSAHGRASTVRADYLVATDAASGELRRRLGMGWEEPEAPTRLWSVSFRSRDPALRRHGPSGLTISAEGVLLAPCDEDEVWTLSVARRAELDDPVGLIGQQLGVVVAADDVVSTAAWQTSRAVAARYRCGPVFLAGDAAHRFWPAGGQGIAAGIADAVDLGWKLAAVVAGWAGPGLLDSYEAERRPVALFIRELCAGLVELVRRFSRLAGAGVSAEHLAGLLELQTHQIDSPGVHFGHRHAGSPVVAHEPGLPPLWSWHRITSSTWPGGRAPAVLLDTGEQLFDRLGMAFTLIDLTGVGEGAGLVNQARARGIPMAHLPLDDPAVRSCYERDLVLIRPDQHVAWRGNQAPADWSTVLDVITGWRPGHSRKHVMGPPATRR